MFSIIGYLNEAGYRITGECPNGNWIGYDRNGNEVSNNASFCIRAVDVSQDYHNDIDEKCNNGKCNTTYDDFPKMIYYDVVVFYQ